MLISYLILTLLDEYDMLLKHYISLGKSMSKPMNPQEQDAFDQFEEDKEEQIQQIMTEKGCSEDTATAIWEEEYNNNVTRFI